MREKREMTRKGLIERSTQVSLRVCAGRRAQAAGQRRAVLADPKGLASMAEERGKECRASGKWLAELRLPLQ